MTTTVAATAALMPTKRALKQKGKVDSHAIIVRVHFFVSVGECNGESDGQREDEAGTRACIVGIEHELATKTGGDVAGYGEADA